MKQEEKFEVNLMLPNGKWFANGNGIDIVALIGLKRVRRFFNLPIPDDIRFTVVDHSMLGSLMIPLYCDYMSKNFKNGEYAETYNDSNFRLALFQAFLTHDIEECIVGDLPAPIKSIEIEKIKDYVRDCVRKYLAVQLPHGAAALEVAVKHIDFISALVELYEYAPFWHNKNETANVEILKYYLPKVEQTEDLFEFLKVLSVEMYSFYKKIQKLI